MSARAIGVQAASRRSSSARAVVRTASPAATSGSIDSSRWSGSAAGSAGAVANTRQASRSAIALMPAISDARASEGGGPKATSAIRRWTSRASRATASASAARAVNSSIFAWLRARHEGSSASFLPQTGQSPSPWASKWRMAIRRMSIVSRASPAGVAATAASRAAIERRSAASSRTSSRFGIERLARPRRRPISSAVEPAVEAAEASRACSAAARSHVRLLRALWAALARGSSIDSSWARSAESFALASSIALVLGRRAFLSNCSASSISSSPRMRDRRS